ncbi:fimbrial protein [Pseudomonas frederiksbergensis]|uniref:fimbrial protein n=1 Tax=Pseudomonas frederiksbergensis TaxID=104087 RepID=UPI003D00E6DF
MTINLLIARLGQWLAAITLLIGWSGVANAAFVHNSCASASAQALDWTYYPIPADPPAGFVIAQRAIILGYTYRKTGADADELLTGAQWAELGAFNSTYRTLPVVGVDGVGTRFSSFHDITHYFGTSGQGANFTTAAIVVPENNTGQITEFYLQQLVMTDPRIFKGGTATSVAGILTFAMRSRFTLNNGLARAPVCAADQVVMGGSLMNFGGGPPLKPLPPPETPTCTATTGNLNFSVNLTPISPSDLAETGSLSRGTPVSVQLTNCKANARPYITFTDSNDRNNRTTNLSLSADSVATGVALRLMNGNSAVRFGAQDTTVSSSNVGQFAMGTTTAGGSIVLALQAHYVRTAKTIRPGALRAGAIITIVYP